MTKNNTKVYDMYLDGIYQATGSTKILADYIRVSRQTLERYLYEGNDKGYTFEHIGKYAQIYALYKKEKFMMFGTLKQLSEHTGMPMTRLEWFRTPSSEKRGGNYQVVKIEGEHEVVKDLAIRWRENLYEVKRRGEIYTGTSEQISKEMNVKREYAPSAGKLIGTRYAQLKVVDLETSETFYGNIEDVQDFTGMTSAHIKKMVKNTHHTSPNWEVTFTGQYIVDLIGADKPKAVKPVSDHVSVKPVYSHKPVPMSRYAKELLDWSTKHLRRDA